MEQLGPKFEFGTSSFAINIFNETGKPLSYRHIYYNELFGEKPATSESKYFARNFLIKTSDPEEGVQKSSEILFYKVRLVGRIFPVRSSFGGRASPVCAVLIPPFPQDELKAVHFLQETANFLLSFQEMENFYNSDNKNLTIAAIAADDSFPTFAYFVSHYKSKKFLSLEFDLETIKKWLFSCIKNGKDFSFVSWSTYLSGPGFNLCYEKDKTFHLDKKKMETLPLPSILEGKELLFCVKVKEKKSFFTQKIFGRFVVIFFCMTFLAIPLIARLKDKTEPNKPLSDNIKAQSASLPKVNIRLIERKRSLK
jgi:hypothetical protein